jgi:hypothetical protein
MDNKTNSIWSKTNVFLFVGLLSITSVLAIVPEKAKLYIPVLKQSLEKEWPTFKKQSLIAAQIEQESCISLTSKGCWNPNTELKTKDEYGFGLGQLTIAYDKNHNVRFDNFQIMKQKFPQLKEWKWENRYDPYYQLTTIVLMDKNFYNGIRWDTASDDERIAFMLASYNGGLGGTMQDRTICAHTNGCDPSKWFDNVERYSYKSRIKKAGYGQSAFDINRGYVRNIFYVRRDKYIPYFP